VVAQQIDCLASVGSFVDQQRSASQCCNEELPDFGIVIDHQNAPVLLTRHFTPLRIDA
jgi:hypothetical protein